MIVRSSNFLKRTILSMGLIALLALGTQFVEAITLTAESTEKVVIDEALRGTVCVETTNDCKEIVAGIGYVYPRGAPPEFNPRDPRTETRVALFIFDNQIHRAAGYGPQFERVNCRNVEVDFPPKGDQPGGRRTVEQCDERPIPGAEEGANTIVRPDGTENPVRESAYEIRYGADSSIKDLTFILWRENMPRESAPRYKLTTVEKRVKHVEWRPGSSAF